MQTVQGVRFSGTSVLRSIKIICYLKLINWVCFTLSEYDPVFCTFIDIDEWLRTLDIIQYSN